MFDFFFVIFQSDRIVDLKEKKNMKYTYRHSPFAILDDPFARFKENMISFQIT